MQDTYGRIVSFIMAVIFMTLVPAMLILNYSDSVVTSYVNNTIEEFVDTCRKTGCVSEDAYYLMLDKLSGTGYTFQTDITCSTKTNYPDGENYLTDWFPHNNQDVMEGIASIVGGNPNSTYPLNEDDYITITVKSIEEATSSVMSRFVTLGTGGEKHIICTYSGYVGTTD